MARKQIIEVQCERCQRIEKLDTTSVKPGPTPIIDFEFEGKRTTYDDLCSPCFRAVKGHVEAISKKLDSVSPDRKPKKEPVAKEKVGATAPTFSTSPKIK